MTLYWGVDSSYHPADSPVRAPRSSKPIPLFDYVTQWAGRMPDFWGRYLNGNEIRLTPGEADFIFRQSGGRCRILLVYTGIRDGHRERRQDGVHAANQAIQRADALGVPSGVRIYADLEGWRVGREWILGWWETMYQSRFAGSGGLYGRAAELPRRTRTGAREVPRPAAGSWAANAAAAEDRFADWTAPSASDLAGQILAGTRQKSVTPYIWSNMPRQMGDPPAGQVIPTAFGAIGPAGVLLEVAVWQYRLGCPLGTHAHHGLVDLDLATDRGYADMWH